MCEQTCSLENYSTQLSLLRVQRRLFRDIVKQNMSPKAQIASVISVALAFCLLIWCVTFALDQSFVAKRTIEFQESQLAAVNQVAQRVRWQRLLPLVPVLQNVVRSG